MLLAMTGPIGSLRPTAHDPSSPSQLLVPGGHILETSYQNLRKINNIQQHDAKISANYNIIIIALLFPNSRVVLR